MSVKQIRAYQQEAVDAARLHLYDRGYGATICFLATGLGKTLISAEFLKQTLDFHTQRAMFLVNWQEIIRQSYRVMVEQMPELKRSDWTKYGRPGAGMVMGFADTPSARLVVATPQTLSSREGPTKRLERVLEYGPIDTLIVDEAHYGVAKSYLLLIKRLREANPNLKILGLTATPQREDGLALGMVFDTICFSRNIKWGIKNGYLCEILDPLLIETNLDLPEGRGSIDDRAKALDVGNWSQILANSLVAHGEGRPTVSFLPSVAHSVKYVEHLRERGIQAAHIDGEGCIGPNGDVLPIAARAELFRLHQQGDIQVLSCYAVLGIGWDAPWVSHIQFARPTQNEIILTQYIGRGTRIYPGKKNLLVTDFTLKNVKLLTTGSLLGFTWKEAGEKTEDEQEEEPFLEGLNLKDFKTDDSLVNGNGLIVRVGTLFKSLSGAWYHDQDTGTLSLSASRTAMFLIHTPNYTLANRLREGMANGAKYLDNGALTAEQRQHGEAFYEALAKAYEVYSQYTAWFVEGEEQLNQFTGKQSVVWYAPEKWFASGDSVELVFDYIAPFLAEMEDPTLSRKNQSWRRPSELPTPAQLSLLARKGLVPTTKGEASQMIAHGIAWEKVGKVVDKLRNAAGKYGILDGR